MKMIVLAVVTIVELALMILHILCIDIPILTISPGTYAALKDDKTILRKYHKRSAIYTTAAFLSTLAAIYFCQIAFVAGMIICWLIMLAAMLLYAIRINSR